MNDDATARLSWVKKQDGRLVPFEADRISRDLFLAGERLGQPDAFRARELTDSILHFLALESEGSVPTTSQVAELAVKVVRELGHPALAQALGQQALAPSADGIRAQPDAPGMALADVERALQTSWSPGQLAQRLSQDSLARYSLEHVYSRDLAALHRDGLLTIGNLDSPLQLAGLLLETPRPASRFGQLLVSVLQARQLVGEAIVLDGPEHIFADASTADLTAASLAHELRLGLEATALRALVNLNCEQPPAGVGQLAEGPLFAGATPIAPRSSDIALGLLDAIADEIPSRVASATLHIDWHLGERDFQPKAVTRLERLVLPLAEHVAIAFVFDRPRRPVPLAEGFDRQQPATLVTVGLNLPRLAEQPGVRGRPEPFLDKLESLVRMAFSVAGQKRDFLRRRCPALGRGFLLDRARLVLVPLGLEALVRQRFGQPIAAGAAGLEFARSVLQRLRDAIRQTSRSRRLEARLDYPHRLNLHEAELLEPPATARQLVAATGQLQAITGGGTALVPALPAAEAVELIRYAWQHTDVVRLRFLRGTAAQPRPDLWESQNL